MQGKYRGVTGRSRKGHTDNSSCAPEGADVAALVERNMLEHISFDLVEHTYKVEEEVCAEKEKLMKIMEDFQNKIRASKFMEQ